MMDARITAWTEGTETRYGIAEQRDSPNLAEASMLLAALHVLERRVIEFIEECEPDYNIQSEEE